jgi:signal transduction histidine kinase
VNVRRRLLVSTVLIALAAVLVLGLPLGFVGGRLLQQRSEQRLEREADTAAGALARRIADGEKIDASVLDAYTEPGHQLEVVLPGGRRLAGTRPIDGAVTRVAAGDDAALRVVVLAPAHERTEDVGAVWLAVIVLSLVAVAVAVGLARVQGRRLARPLERLSEQARRIGSPVAEVSHEHAGIDEIDRVSHALARADERVTEALRREREFSANASHQLRSPLTGLRMRLEELESGSASADVSAEAGAALAQADRMMATIAGLEQLAASRGEQAEPTDLARLAAHHVGGEWRRRYAAAGRELTVVPERGVQGRLDPEVARQLLDVLLDNALEHGAGAVRVRLATDPGWARLSVEDEGEGVGDAAVAHVFDRRWSGAGGNGIGLALARELVRQSGGELSLARARPARFDALVPAPDGREA